MPPQKKKNGWVISAMIIGGLAGLIFGGNIFLDSAISIARAAGIKDATIAITLMAGGTSLPELAASTVSAIKGRSQLALGNVVGSNISNIFLVLGASAHFGRHYHRRYAGHGRLFYLTADYGIYVQEKEDRPY